MKNNTIKKSDFILFEADFAQVVDYFDFTIIENGKPKHVIVFDESKSETEQEKIIASVYEKVGVSNV